MKRDVGSTTMRQIARISLGQRPRRNRQQVSNHHSSRWTVKLELP